MKNFLTFLLGVVCVAVLILGHFYWNNQIQAAAAKTKSEVTQTPASSTKAVTLAANNQNQETDFSGLTKNWPLAAVHQFNKDLTEHKAFKVLFVGSPAIGSEITGTYKIVKNQLLHIYGEKNLEVSLQTFDTNSGQLTDQNSEKEIVSAKANLIVLEPLLLLDNGVVPIDQSLQNITEFISAVKASNPDTTFILQPSYPLYNAKFYPRQVAELKDYAEKNFIPFLDHWTAWPDANTSTLQGYLLPDQSAPNDKGNQVWSQYLIHYFINK